VFFVKNYLPDRVAHWGATGLAQRDAGNSRGRQSFCQQANLGALARAFSPLEDNELTARPRHSQPRVMIGLAAPFFIPSMIH
jgi:hypothetical protein